MFGAADDRDVPGAVAEGGDILKGCQLLGLGSCGDGGDGNITV